MRPMPSFETMSAYVEEVHAEIRRIESEEPAELRKLRTGALDDRAGSYGQYFGTWDIAAGMLRDFSMYTLYPLLRIARSQQASDLQPFIEELFEPYTNYLGYSGMPTLERFSLGLRSLAKSADRAGIEAGLSAYFRYANRLYSWVYHYFPWGLGEHFVYSDEAAFEQPEPREAETAHPSDLLIRMTWPELDTSVRATLAVHANPELCTELYDALPFKIIQSHPMVSGKSLFAWTPLASTAPIRTREEIRLAPKGRLRFSQRTGQKLILQYGPTTETIMAPVLGMVLPEDIHKLDAVGEAIWDSVYKTKQKIWLEVERC